MKTFTLSGWGQPHDSLRTVAQDAYHFDYSDMADVDAILDALERDAKDAELIIGWSLGGQLAARAIAQKLIAPERLVLVGTPYQFVQNASVPQLGMKSGTFSLFRDNLARDPKRTLKKAWALVSLRDEREEDVAKLMAQLGHAMPPRNWLKWLDALSRFSFENEDLSHFPPTLLVHGKNDEVVAAEQAHAFARRIPGAQVEIWEGCGHAPHLHDAPRLRERIDRHVL